MEAGGKKEEGRGWKGREEENGRERERGKRRWLKGEEKQMGWGRAGKILGG